MTVNSDFKNIKVLDLKSNSKIVIDACSYIYLEKSGILPYFKEFLILIPEKVKNEILEKSDIVFSTNINLVFSSFKFFKNLRNLKLKGGEREVLLVFYEYNADAILTDDKALIMFCEKEKIPFFSAILVPFYLYLIGSISKELMFEFTKRISKLGRYSFSIKERVKQFLISQFEEVDIE